MNDFVSHVAASWRCGGRGVGAANERMQLDARLSPTPGIRARVRRNLQIVTGRLRRSRLAG
jgi:hypothetical protein